MKKLFFHIHLWLSIPLGIFITIICLSGAMLAFQNEINKKVYHDRYYADVMTTMAIPLNKLIPMVNKQLHNGNKVISAEISSDPTKNYIMGLSKGVMASAYVNQYTGRLVEISSFNDGFFGKVRQLHKTLFAGFVGKMIVGYTTLFFAFIVISGIILWWPRSKKSLKTQLTIHTKYGWKRFWIDLHLRGGIYICIGLLVLSLTGLFFAFDWYQKGVFSLFGTETNKKSAESNNIDKHSEKDINYAAWTVAVNSVRQKYSDIKSINVQDGSVSVKPHYTFGNTRYADMYIFNSGNGKIVKALPYNTQDKQDKISGWIFTLHTGRWGGLFSEILTFIVALIGAALPIIGYYQYFARAKRNKGNKS